MIPRRTKNAEYLAQASEWAISWPRPHRQTFALIDGKRHVDRLAQILHLPPPQITKIVHDLLWLCSYPGKRS